MANPVYKTHNGSDLRLECLKLACRPGLGPSEVTAIADVYLGWIVDRGTRRGSGHSDEYRASSMSPDDSRKDGDDEAPVTRTSPKKIL